ncbi:flagellar basal body rod protein FlgB [Salinarimonas ramus]|uniref:Flagellar basal body rod protein FlgB n=1 Tax=Salinarimonas ramus TaxID=690164 RepID=A0A917V4Y1_9HYPH|nr:flagellar basal body rod protein FlgB [Salinarimonas ramus]GGK37305.1 flagellar basal body rod protein FlgB [Salinarimonas ramus]
MSAAGLPLLEMLKTRLHWHQARQKLLAENVANADTPGFAPRDVAQPRFGADGRAVSTTLSPVRTSPLHIAPANASRNVSETDGARFEVRPSGNAVNLEEEMLKVAQNQADYQLAASLYERNLAMLRTAVGRR